MAGRVNQICKRSFPARAGFLLREDHILKPHDSTTIRQNMLAMGIKSIKTSIDELEKSLEEHLKKKKKKQFTHPAEF